ncbi:MAG: hypothetical protein ACPGVI_02160 [Crocinitomicaceae bacterium]
MAIVLFAGVGRSYIPMGTAKLIFIISGAIGLVLNLLSFKTGKHGPLFNFLYWTGSIVLFIGLNFILLKYPYGFYIIVSGIFILGISFILPEKLAESNNKNEDLLDN